MLDTALAVLLNGAGVAAVYGVWRGSLPRGKGLVPGGWLAMFAGGVFWCRAAGVEFGSVYALLFTTFAAWVAVVVNHELRARKGAVQAAAQSVVPDSATLARHAARFVVAVPVAALAAAFVGAVVAKWLPVGRVEAMAAAVLGIPVLWGLASYWATAAERLRAPALGLTLAGAAAAVYLYAG